MMYDPYIHLKNNQFPVFPTNESHYKVSLLRYDVRQNLSKVLSFKVNAPLAPPTFQLELSY